jgi:hypothetical protein
MARAKKNQPKPEPAAEPTYLDLRAQLKEVEERKSQTRSEAATLAKEYEAKTTALDEEAKPLKDAMRRMESEALVTAVPVLLTLVPEHNMRGCSDEDHHNYGEGCTRCALLYVQSYNHLSREFEVEIRLHNREDPWV